MPLEDATEDDMKEFLKEIELMKTISEFSSPHVVNMVGASTVNKPLLLITEFMRYGDLFNYLKSCREEVSINSSSHWIQHAYVTINHVVLLKI